jgi:hypothetical protein
MLGMRRRRSLGLAPSGSRAPCSRAANRVRVPATGHSSIQVTVDLYGHFEPGGDRHHVEDLAQAIEAERSAAEARVVRWRRHTSRPPTPTLQRRSGGAAPQRSHHHRVATLRPPPSGLAPLGGATTRARRFDKRPSKNPPPGFGIITQGQRFVEDDAGVVPGRGVKRTKPARSALPASRQRPAAARVPVDGGARVGHAQGCSSRPSLDSPEPARE